MKKRIYLPKSIEELRRLSHQKQAELWARYVESSYKRQLRSLWYYISCENLHIQIERKYKIKMIKYAQVPESCLGRVVKKKYILAVGTEIAKTFRGIEFKLTVVGENDFIFRDKHYRSLSAVAKEICGHQVSGPDFFGLRNKRIRKELCE